MARPLRIFYAAGPGDVLGTYRHWREGRDDPSQVSMTYSGQFYDLCREIDAQACVIASHPSRQTLHEGRFIIKHRPIPLSQARGGLYHLGQVLSGLRLLWAALLFRADVAVIVCGSAHWFPMRLARLLGIKVVPTLHCVLWRKGQPPTGVRGLVQKLNRKFFTRTVPAIMSASHDITAQVSQLTGGRMRRVFEFLPSYRREQFSGLGEPPQARNPFRVFYAGRVERNKGVFDLLEIARRFARDGRTDIEFDLCGTGGALEELKAAAAQAGVTAHFRCHGHCNKPEMRQKFSQAHIVIVPTTSEFIEGFNQVVAEGVLSGRPVITSSICPALDYVRDAVVEVPPDDVRGYGDAILKLCDDIALYQSKVAACHAAQEQFYDLSKGWGATFKAVLQSIGALEDPQQVQWLAAPASKLS